MNTESTEPTLLIADDNAGVRRVLVHMLAAAGMRTVTAHDGIQALDCARRFLPDLIILDVRMPGPDGFEVCAELRRDAATSRIPIMMLTGQGELETEYAGIGSGADGYLFKPVNFNVLEARVRELLGRKAS
jgi:DNA-binding response OmpR family regulator